MFNFNNYLYRKPITQFSAPVVISVQSLFQDAFPFKDWKGKRAGNEVGYQFKSRGIRRALQVESLKANLSVVSGLVLK